MIVSLTLTIGVEVVVVARFSGKATSDNNFVYIHWQKYNVSKTNLNLGFQYPLRRHKQKHQQYIIISSNNTVGLTIWVYPERQVHLGNGCSTMAVV